MVVVRGRGLGWSVMMGGAGIGAWWGQGCAWPSSSFAQNTASYNICAFTDYYSYWYQYSFYSLGMHLAAHASRAAVVFQRRTDDATQHVAGCRAPNLPDSSRHTRPRLPMALLGLSAFESFEKVNAGRPFDSRPFSCSTLLTATREREAIVDFVFLQAP